MLELNKFIKIKDNIGQISYFMIDKIISETEFVSDCDIINLNNFYFKKCKKQIWKPIVGEFCYYPYGKDSFAVSQIKEIDINTIYFVNGDSEEIKNVEPFNISCYSNGLPTFLRYLR